MRRRPLGFPRAPLWWRVWFVVVLIGAVVSATYTLRVRARCVEAGGLTVTDAAGLPACVNGAAVIVSPEHRP